MFDRREERICTACGVRLVALDKLPPSSDSLHDGTGRRADEEVDQPQHVRLAITHVRRGRGLLTVLAVLGLGAFFLPWVRVTLPDLVDYSGFDLARRLGWTWGAAVGWFVLLPTVFTRRTIAQMRGARVAVSFLAAIPGITAAVLLLRPPHGGHGVPLRFTFGPGLYGSLALSLVAVAMGLFFGGRVDDIRLDQGSSRGQLVH